MILQGKGYKVFRALDYIIIGLLALSCLLPLLNVLAISFSSPSAVASNSVSFWPKEFSLDAYEYVLNDVQFLKAFLVSVLRLILGCSVNLFLTILSAYPLSKSNQRFKARTLYAWYFLFTSFIGGGLIPVFLVVRATGLIDTIWAFVIPSAVPVFSVILMINFFRGIPGALEEAALIDGAGHWTTMWKIYIPLSAASIATITLFALVGHWNSWFDGVIYINNIDMQPVATYLRTKVILGSLDSIKNITDMQALLRLQKLSDRTIKSALIFVGTVPILLAYPFLQKHFAKGITIGSLKE